jgi:hypothetical protein
VITMANGQLESGIMLSLVHSHMLSSCLSLSPARLRPRGQFNATARQVTHPVRCALLIPTQFRTYNRASSCRSAHVRKSRGNEKKLARAADKNASSKDLLRLPIIQASKQRRSAVQMHYIVMHIPACKTLMSPPLATLHFPM